jgi:transcriptional regulator with PAS, ATPase and Fis domain
MTPGLTGANPVGEDPLITRNPAMKGMVNFLKQVAATDSNVLITGETGTGKELVAALIHKYGDRAKKPFVVINCAAIPDTLLESELFGYEKGAFTGAYARREGALRLADSGTVFLDEIGDMSSHAQAKVLRMMEQKEVCRVGGINTIPINVRFIAATNQDLEQLMQEEKFRPDLYFRLNVARIYIPPLRERKEDIVLLLDYFRRKLNREFGKQVEGFTPDAVEALMDYDWPGNVRELKNRLEAAFIGADGIMGLKDFPEFFRRQLQENKGLSQDERARLLSALFNTRWNKTKAAQQLQWSRMTLYRKMVKYGISAFLKEESGEVTWMSN